MVFGMSDISPPPPHYSVTIPLHYNVFELKDYYFYLILFQIDVFHAAKYGKI